MKLGMMQPYFFPYIGYFSLIQSTDVWVIFDTAQYVRRGWVNRNRVLCDGREPWKYVRIPVVHSPRNTSIADTLIDSQQDWTSELLNQLDAYQRRRAPNFDQVRDWLAQQLAPLANARSSSETSDHEQSGTKLSDVLASLLIGTCEYLGINRTLHRFSQLNLSFDSEPGPGEWALETARHLGATTYINAPGGQELFSDEAFQSAGIELLFLTHQLPGYSQGNKPFVPGLSILDVMMWNSPEQIQEQLSSFTTHRIHDRTHEV